MSNFSRCPNDTECVLTEIFDEGSVRGERNELGKRKNTGRVSILCIGRSCGLATTVSYHFMPTDSGCCGCPVRISPAITCSCWKRNKSLPKLDARGKLNSGVDHLT